MFWQKIRSGVMFAASVITCPCHLPIVLPLVLALLAGTPAAVWITQNVGWVYGGMTLLFFVSLALGFRSPARSFVQFQPVLPAKESLLHRRAGEANRREVYATKKRDLSQVAHSLSVKRLWRT